MRPTDASGGLLHYADSTDVVFHDASSDVRVWYATEGADAPVDSGASPSGAPPSVELVGEVVDSALGEFEQMGFRSPGRDGNYAACASNGGDGRIDVYLIDFPSGADGSAGVDSCSSGAPSSCSGFVLLENDFDGRGYASFEEAVEIVGPHELFHLVQNAYTAEGERWWSEGTAQWAADRLRPELEDLERFLPDFFAHPDQPLDVSGGGVTNGRLYATAIWPVFLEHRFDSDVVRQVLEAMVGDRQSVLEATSAVLDTRGVALADAFLEFAAFNGATGTRAPVDEGYPDAAAYPLVPTTLLADEPGVVHEGVLAGLSAQYFVSSVPRRLSLDVDPSAAGGLVIPVVDGRAQLSQAAPLPLDLTTEAIVVVAGRLIGKRDVAFALSSLPLPVALPEPEPPSATEPAGGGCAVGPNSPPGGQWLALSVFALALRRRGLRKEMS